MATYEIKAPDGSAWEVNAPDNATEAQVLEYAKSQWQQPKAPENSLGRQVGLTARSAIKGVAGIPAMVGDALFSVGNLAQRAVGMEPTEAPGRSSRALDEVLNKFLPSPSTPVERVSGEISSAMTGTGAVAGLSRLARPATDLGKNIATALYSNTPAQMTSAASGGASGSVANEAGLPWWAQTMASFGGGAAPVVAGRKYFGQFDSPQEPVSPNTNLEAYKAAGTTPSAGQATGSNFFASLENLAARFPGGQGVMKTFRDRQQEDLGKTTATGGTAESAGRAVEQGLRGPGGFMDRFKATRTSLYDKLDEFLPLERKIDTTKTQKVLADINADIPGAPALSQLFKNSRIVGIERALDDDINQSGTMGNPVTRNQADMVASLPDQKQLPYEAIKKLRTLVGEQIDNASIVSDVPRSKWKALYGALSEDLGIAAKAAGPKAEKAWARANNYNRSAMSRIEGVLDKVLGDSKTPEQVFAAINPRNADQMTTLRATMKSLLPEERQVVTDAVVARLGKATPGNQDDVGGVFSSETFLTNYNRMSPQAKEVLFPTLTQRNAMEAIAKVAATNRDHSKSFANPSGSAGSGAAYTMIGAAGYGLMQGHVGPAAAAASLVTGANIGARMLTNPRVVTWLAQGARAKPGQMASHLSRLATIYTDTSDPELKAELSSYMESVK
jgi:hypothetical protein